MGNASPFSTTPTALHRNSIWHIDLAQLPIEAEVGGDVLMPWTIRLVDAATRGICGTVITPGTPCRADVLAALRAALLQHEPYGPMGGLPRHVRIDRSSDTTTRTVVTDALSALNVRVEPLPAAASDLGSPAELIAVALEETLLASTPHHARLLALRGDGDAGATPSAVPFAQVVDEILAWTTRWNTACSQPALGGRTPSQAWQDDPAPVISIAPALLWTFTIRTDVVTAITGQGVTWHGHHYMAPWMADKCGVRVYIRCMPHDEREIVVCDVVSHAYLGQAFLSDHDGLP